MKTFALSLAFFFTSTFILYAEIPKKFHGTWLPEKYVLALKKYKTHIKALNENKKNYYDVVCITVAEGKDKIYSNVGFHDQYAIDESEFKHNWENKDLKIITDNKKNRYIKISDGTNYYNEMRKFIMKEIFAKKKYKRNGVTFTISDNGTVKFRNIEYRLNLDYMFRNEQYDEFFSQQGQSVKYILVKHAGKKLIVSELEKEFMETEKVTSTYEL